MSLHPFDFEACEPPKESIEQMLEICGGDSPVPENFFVDRLRIPSADEQFINLEAAIEFQNLRDSSDKWNEEEILLAPLVNLRTARVSKQSSHIASISLTDLVKYPRNTFRQSTKIEQQQLETKQEDKRKVFDKWGFVVEDPKDASIPRQNTTRSQTKLEEKWIDITKEWPSYSEEKKRRTLKQ
jgi:hypothetical protein